MTRGRFVIAVLGALQLALLAASGASAEEPTYSYSLTPLGALGNGGAIALDVNDAGQVVGVSNSPGGSAHAFLWQAGAMSDLGTLAGVGSSVAHAINNAGQVAGLSTVPDAQGIPREHACLWQNGVWRDLGTLPGGLYSVAVGINDAGQVVGTSEVAGAGGAIDRHAFLWDPASGMHDLGALEGGQSQAFDINGAGQVVGRAWGPVDSFPFFWTPDRPNCTSGRMVALGGGQGLAERLNDAGEVAGSLWPAGGGSRAIVWDSAGAIHDLGAFFEANFAHGINGIGQVVGASIWTYCYDTEYGTYCESGSTATYWDSAGGLRALFSLFWERPSGSGYPDTARAISDSGLIIAGNAQESFLLTPSPLPARPALGGATAGDAVVTFNWNSSSGAERYTVKRSAGGGPYEVIASDVTATTYTDTSVTNGTGYFYAVSAANSFGESDDSNAAYAAPIPPPDAPTGLTATPGDNSVQLAWNAGGWAEYYAIKRATAPGGPYELIDWAYETGYWDGGVTNGTPYYYVVSALNRMGESPDSGEASATPFLPAPSPPSGLEARPGDRQVTLVWNPGAYAHGSNVKRSTTPGGPYTTIEGWVPYGSYTDTGLTNGSSYYYVVSSVNASGESENSNEASAVPTPPPPPPTGLEARGGRRTVNLSWTQSAGPGISENRIYHSNANRGPYSHIASIPAGTSHKLAAGNRNRTQYYRVTAVNANGQESVYSNQAPVRPR